MDLEHEFDHLPSQWHYGLVPVALFVEVLQTPSAVRDLTKEAFDDVVGEWPHVVEMVQRFRNLEVAAFDLLHLAINN